MAKGHDKIIADGKKFFKKMEDLSKLQVRVGFQRGEHVDDRGTDMVDIAAWNELGTSGMPSRPFLRRTADAEKATIEKVMEAQLKKAVQGGSAEQALNGVGSVVKGLVQDTITRSKEWAAENEDSTIKQKNRKKSTNRTASSAAPLIDSGKMFQSVHYVIKPREG